MTLDDRIYLQWLNSFIGICANNVGVGGLMLGSALALLSA
jgi:hypothetical protein